MKTLTFLLSLIAALTFTVSNVAVANDDKYTEIMQKNIKAVYEAQAIPDIQAAVNTFERVAAAEKTRWEPYYYASFGYIMMATREQDKDKKDAYLDQALKGIAKAQQLAPAESEIAALEGFAYMIRVSVDPGSRGAQYAPVATQILHKAVAMNGENPRAYALLGQMQYGTAEFFGSATTEACATLDKALQKFATFTSTNPLAPRWGQGMAEGAKAKCH
jgi:hypothetical protein